jgi:radical SAM protein with 4Fe4S-binding SPASM domain
VYCQQSLPAEEAERILGAKGHMSLRTFQEAVDGMAEFQDRFKVFNFCGTGETLLTPDLSAMIAYAKEKNVVKRTNVVTNGSSLTYEMSDQLLEAGLDSLRISIQGLDAERYKEMCGVDLDFDRLLDQIRHFYRRRRHCEVHIKIIDIALGGYTKENFYDLFGDISTSVAVEYFVPNQQISYEKVNLDGRDVTVHGMRKQAVKVCFSAFYALTLYMDGRVTPCCLTRPPLYLGNVHETAMYDLWNSSRMKNFWKAQLMDRGSIKGCADCERPSNALQPGDNLDDYAGEILRRISER